MNSKLLIGLAAVVIIVVVGLVALGGSKKQTQTSPTSQSVEQPTTPPNQAQTTRQDTTVTVDSSGFFLATLTIKVGTRVIWTNKSGSAISVNSDIHPTHRLYPPLNLGEVPNGENITLVFDKAGTYKYHDHYNPSHTGTVVVE